MLACSVASNSLRPHRLYSSPGSSVHGIFQAIILEWVAISFYNIYLYTHTIFLNLCYNSQYVIEYVFHRDNFYVVI